MRRASTLWAWLGPGLFCFAFLAAAAPRPWLDYRTIMWIGDSAGRQPEKFPVFLQRLREMGINTAMVYGDADPAPLWQNHFPYYVENMVNRGLCLKWNSSVTNWDKFVTDWSKTGRPAAALARDYCLDDPKWRQWAQEEVERIAARNAPHQPLAFNLRDELSTTFSTNPFDYDFNPIALAAFRRRLQTQYKDLAALNAEWDTSFATWNDVAPFTTDQIKARMSGQRPATKPDWQALEAMTFDPAAARKDPARWNFSPWADFRTYMDGSLADALDNLRQAARRADPQTPVGIEGTQMPSAFGGYDLWKLSRVLDWAEPYDIGNAREIFGSFMPGRPIMTTVFEHDTDHARRRLWHLLLEGDRGCIVWWSEDCIDFRSADDALTAKAKALAPVLREMTSPLARLFLRAAAVRDPVFIRYSQSSVQADWLIESAADGSTWLRRFSSYEAAHNHAAAERDGWLKALEDLGCAPQFISSEQIEAGELRTNTNAVVVLSSAYAMSDKETEQLNLLGKGHVLFDSEPGAFDAHCKPRKNAAQWRGGYDGDPALYASQRLSANPLPSVSTLAGWLAARLRPAAISLPPKDCVRVRRFRSRGATLLAFERNVEYAMSESLAQGGGNEALEKPVKLNVKLPRPAHIYDLNGRVYLGRADHIEFTLDPWRPSLFAITDGKLASDSIIDDLTETGL